MNYLELCQQLVEDAGISGGIESTIDQSGEFQRVVNWIKRAVTEIEGLWFDWDFLYVPGSNNLINTVVNVKDYFAPVELNVWDQNAFIRQSEQSQLEYWMWVRVKNDPSLSSAGDPYAFTIMPDQRIRLFSTPTVVEVIEAPFWAKPTVLAIDSDIPAIPEQFHDIVVYKALQYYSNYESAEEAKMQALEAYQQRLRQLESHSAPGRQGHGNINTGFDLQVLAEGSNYGY